MDGYATRGRLPPVPNARDGATSHVVAIASDEQRSANRRSRRRGGGIFTMTESKCDLRVGSEPAQEDEAVDDHLADLPDGCGCAEVWEHLTDRRAADDD